MFHLLKPIVYHLFISWHQLPLVQLHADKYLPYEFRVIYGTNALSNKTYTTLEKLCPNLFGVFSMILLPCVLSYCENDSSGYYYPIWTVVVILLTRNTDPHEISTNSSFVKHTFCHQMVLFSLQDLELRGQSVLTFSVQVITNISFPFINAILRFLPKCKNSAIYCISWGRRDDKGSLYSLCKALYATLSQDLKSFFRNIQLLEFVQWGVKSHSPLL